MTARHMSMAEAVEAGADAFFDEKYGELVRTIAVEGYSHELCGGTHCRATGQIGGFIITGERSIGSGMRRIEAVTGEAAEALTEERFRDPRGALAAAGAQTAEQLAARIEELKQSARRRTQRDAPIARRGGAFGGRHAEGTVRRVPGGLPRPLPT